MHAKCHTHVCAGKEKQFINILLRHVVDYVRNVLHRLQYVHPWLSVGGVIWGGFGIVALLEEVYNRGVRFEMLKSPSVWWYE